MALLAGFSGAHRAAVAVTAVAAPADDDLNGAPHADEEPLATHAHARTLPLQAPPLPPRRATRGMMLLRQNLDVMVGFLRIHVIGNSQCPTAVGRPSFEAGTPDPRGLIEGPTDRKSTRSIAVRKPRGSGVA